jgi:hypothetical protein
MLMGTSQLLLLSLMAERLVTTPLQQLLTVLVLLLRATWQ